jgi:hypothetical protein
MTNAVNTATVASARPAHALRNLDVDLVSERTAVAVAMGRG